jgi:hypothetical protein
MISTTMGVTMRVRGFDPAAGVLEPGRQVDADVGLAAFGAPAGHDLGDETIERRDGRNEAPGAVLGRIHE